MTELIVNVTKMFAHHEPWDCSNSEANLGPRCAELTWQCALEVARGQGAWLLSNAGAAFSAIGAWMETTGAWAAEEIETMGDDVLLAVLVQNVASDLRGFGSDHSDLEAVADDYEGELGSCIMGLEITDDGVLAHVYMGS